MACVFDGNRQITFVLRICPKYWISLEKKCHLLSFMKVLLNRVSQKPVWCVLGVLLGFAEYNDVQISYHEIEVFQDNGH